MNARWLVFGLGLVSALPAHGHSETTGMEVVTGVIEAGTGHQSRDAFRFGRYTGRVDEGFFAILNLEWLMRAPYDSTRGDFLRASARDLGLESRRAMVEYGRQGRFVLRAGYDRIPTYASQAARTPFNHADPADLTLPDDWVAAPTPAAMSALLPVLGEVDIRQRRRATGAGVTAHAAQRWTFSTDLQEERRQGTRLMAGVMGSTGGNARAALLPAPVDYRTRRFDATARYADTRRQFSFGYHLSLFDNDNPALAWDNPYVGVAGWDTAAFHPHGRGQVALPPDNRFHQVRAAGGYAVSERTRVTADLAVGRMTQDEAFLPYTVNPQLAASVTHPLPRDTLDGRIDTTVLNLRLSGRPMPRLQLNAAYRLDDRDNRTPMDEYIYIGGDAQMQDADEASSRRRFNLPYSYREHRLGMDMRYRLGAGRTDLRAGLQHRRIERDFSDRERTDETLLTLGLNRGFTHWLNAALRAELAERGGSTYEENSVLQHGFAPGYAQTVAGGWINVPGLRQFHLADRRRHRLGGSVSMTAGERWAVNLEAAHTHDDYRKSEIGLSGASIFNGSLDVTYAAGRDGSLHAFYAREQLRARQHGHSVRGGANKLPDLANPERAWSARHADEADTVGAGVERRWRNERLRLSADYVFTRHRARVTTRAGAALETGPLPAVTRRIHGLRLRADYRLTARTSLSLSWWHERYRSDDWALDGVAVDQLANVILASELDPDYRVHVLAATLVWRH